MSMHMLAQVDWDSMSSALCGGVFALVCVYLGYRLERSQAEREKQRDARYRLLVLLRQLQVTIATAVNRKKLDGAGRSDSEQRYDDMVLKLALGESTRSLQDAILDRLRRHDALPELKDIRRALWCSGAGAERWLASLARAVKLMEKRVCPRLRACEDELYAELPEPVRRIIEHPEHP